MALSVDSKIKVLMKNAAAVEVLEQYSPGISTEPQMKMVYGLTLRKLAAFPQAAHLNEKLDEIDEKLKAIEG